MVAVVSETGEGPRYLLLHSVDYPRGEDGDWAWGPPSGCLEPGEGVAACAARELFEETGIRGIPEPVATEGVEWAMFYLWVPWGTHVRLDPAEHNDFAWLTYEYACAWCRPEAPAGTFRTAVAARIAPNQVGRQQGAVMSGRQ